jgi:hypothetical protein
VASFLIFEPRFARGVLHGLRRVRDLLLSVRPEAAAGPPLRAYERIEALEQWICQQGGKGLDLPTVHVILTRVVDETQAVCDLVQSELIAAAPAGAAQRQTQSQESQSQSQSQSTSNEGA